MSRPVGYVGDAISKTNGLTDCSSEKTSGHWFFFRFFFHVRSSRRDVCRRFVKEIIHVYDTTVNHQRTTLVTLVTVLDVLLEVKKKTTAVTVR